MSLLEVKGFPKNIGWKVMVNYITLPYILTLPTVQHVRLFIYKANPSPSQKPSKTPPSNLAGHGSQAKPGLRDTSLFGSNLRESVVDQKVIKVTGCMWSTVQNSLYLWYLPSPGSSFTLVAKYGLSLDFYQHPIPARSPNWRLGRERPCWSWEGKGPKEPVGA